MWAISITSYVLYLEQETYKTAGAVEYILWVSPFILP